MAKRVFLSLVCFMLCLTGGTAAVHPVQAAADGQGPVLENFSATESAGVGQSIMISAKVTDDSGVSHVIATLRYNTVKTLDMTYSEESGRWEAAYKVDESDYHGDWTLSLKMVDSVGNITEADYPNYIHIVNFNNLDLEVPVAHYITIEPKIVFVEDPFSFRVKISDVGTGVKQVQASIRDDMMETPVPIAYDSSTDEWVGTYRFPENTKLTMKSVNIVAVDFAGNKNTFFKSFYPKSKFEDRTPPDNPIVNEVTEKDTVITGTAEAGSHISVSSPYGPVGKGTAGPDGHFSIEITPQEAHIRLLITATDAAGNSSDGTVVYVKDRTPPAKPIVGEVTDKDGSLSGTAEALATIEVRRAGTLIGEARVDVYGNFTAPFIWEKETPWQPAGTQLVVTAIDREGNVSEGTIVVVKDATPPREPFVGTVTDQDTAVVGTTERYSLVEVMTGDVLLGSGTAGEDGSFIVPIPRQKAGTQLQVTATDQAGNKSSSQSVKVFDVTPPSKPNVNPVSNRDSVVTGMAEPGSTVEVHAHVFVIGTGVAGTDGAFSVAIPLQEEGTQLAIIVKDGTGNRSPEISIIVGDIIPPEPPVVNEVLNVDTTVTGMGEAYSTITVFANQTVLGTTVVYPKQNQSIGSFTVAIPVQKEGTKLFITASDRSGNVSSAAVVIVKKAVMYDGWVKENGYTYYLDQITGKKVTGWYQIDQQWYFFDKSTGAMKTGWLSHGGTWYFFAGSGAMVTGWLSDGGKWYYLQQSGAMATGWVHDGKAWYFMNTSGSMVTGWIPSGGAWYFLDNSGAMVTGWLNDAGRWYFLKSSGSMATGWVNDGMAWYFMNASGVIQTGWVSSGGTWYYLASSGAMQTGWLNSGGVWYYFEDSGAMRTGWLESDGAWYYFEHSGVMKTGWVLISGTWYNFASNGALAS